LIVEDPDRRTASAQLKGMLAAAGHEANHVSTSDYAMPMTRRFGKYAIQGIAVLTKDEDLPRGAT